MPFDFRPVFQRALHYKPFLDHYATSEQRERWAKVYDAAVLTAAQKELLGSFRRPMKILCLTGPWCGDCVNGCPVFQRIAEGSALIDLRFVNRNQNFDKAPAPADARIADTDADDIRSRPIGKILVKWGILTPERIEKALLVQEEKKAAGLNVRIGDVLTDMGMISAEQRDHAVAAQSGYPSIDAWDVAVAKELSICAAPRVPVFVFMTEDGYECERFGERTLATYREKARKQLSALEGASCPTGLMAPEADILAANVAEWLGHVERVQWMLLTSPRLMKLHGEA